MKAKSIIFLVFGIVFAGALTLIIGSFFFSFFILPQISAQKRIELNKKRSAETIGKFTSVSEHRRRLEKSGGGGTSYTYNYKYVVNDILYSAAQSSGGGLRSEELKNEVKVKVCYDPADPQSSAFYGLNEAKTCGN